MIYKALFLFLYIFLSTSCLSPEKQPVLKLKFKGEQILKKGLSFENIKVGGLSELFFDVSSGDFYALSDDKKNHRFYKLTLTKEPAYKLEIKEQIFLKSLGHQQLKRNMDPEAIVLYGDNKIFIASEGQQIYKIHEPTQIFTFNRQGVLKSAWPVPSVFWKKGQTNQDPLFGQQENKGFESLTVDKQSDSLWTATEKPLKQDLILKEKFFVRLSAFDIQSRKMLIQYAYPLKEKDSGLVALEFIKPKVFLSLERAYKKKDKNGINKVDLFITDCHRAGNVQDYQQLPKTLKPCSKKQLWTSSQQDTIKVDNLEALALGPMLSPTKQLLVLASDNNFNEEKQKNQLLFFELSFEK